MGQTFTDDCFAGSHVYSTDMGNMETNFATLKSMFSGSSAPGSPAPVGFQPWADTSKKVLKYRNAGATAWVGVMHSDGASQMFWFYVNAAMDGYVVFSWASDKLAAIKGGATYVTGGSSSGTFSMAWADHNHQVLKDGTSGTSQKTWNSGGSEIDTPYYSEPTAAPFILTSPMSGEWFWDGKVDAFYSSMTKLSESEWRPAAAVGTLQILDFI